MADNLTVRIYEDLLKAGFTVALVDAPSDKQGQWGMHEGSFRCTQTHVEDITGVLGFMKREKDIPAWLMGFSMGNHSATYFATVRSENSDGLIITSGITNWTALDTTVYKDYPDGILNMQLDRISVPTLIVHHEKDRREGSPPSRVLNIKEGLKSAKVEIKSISGGSQGSHRCGPTGYHGFKGKEKELLSVISSFISAESN